MFPKYSGGKKIDELDDGYREHIFPNKEKIDRNQKRRKRNTLCGFEYTQRKAIR